MIAHDVAEENLQEEEFRQVLRQNLCGEKTRRAEVSWSVIHQGNMSSIHSGRCTPKHLDWPRISLEAVSRTNRGSSLFPRSTVLAPSWRLPYLNMAGRDHYLFLNSAR